MLNAVRDAMTPTIATYRHLAPQGTDRPYAVLNVLPGEIFRTFVAAQSFQRNTLRVSLWYDYIQDDTVALTASRAVQAALDLQTMGGILLRLAATPGHYVTDADKGRRTFQIVQNYVYEEVRA